MGWQDMPYKYDDDDHMPQAIDNNVIVHRKIIPKNIDLLQLNGCAILNKM